MVSPSHTLRLQPPQSSAACPGCPPPSPTWRRNVPRLYLWQTEALGNSHGYVQCSYQANHRWIKRQLSGQADAILTPVTPLLCSAWSTHTLLPRPTPILRLKTTLTATETNTRAGGHSGEFKLVKYFQYRHEALFPSREKRSEPETQIPGAVVVASCVWRVAVAMATEVKV